MSLLGRWRIVEMPDYTEDYPDIVEPAYILFEDHGRGEFAFGCVTGAIYDSGETDAVEFTWDGNDEMDGASGGGGAELQPDGSLQGEISFKGADHAKFTARREASSTAC